MKRLLLGLLFLVPATGGSQESEGAGEPRAGEASYTGKVVEISVGQKDMADMRKFLEWERILTKAEEDQARAVVLRLDSSGGYPEATKDLMEQLAGLAIPSIGYVEGDVLGGAALVAVSTQTIYMAPDSMVGGGGLVRLDLSESQDERLTQESQMLAKLRSVTAKHGRDQELVQALVAPSRDQKNFGDLIVAQGSLLTRTAE